MKSSFSLKRKSVFARAELLESRRLLSAAYSATQLSALPAVSAEYGPTNPTPMGNDLLFQATDPATGDQGVWLSDGTAAGTRVLPIDLTGDHLLVGSVGGTIFVDVAPASTLDIQEEQIPQLPGELYVTSDLGATFTDLGAVPAGAGYGPAIAVGNELYFKAGPTIYASDGTAAGTRTLITSSDLAASTLQVLNHYLVCGNVSVDLTTGDEATLGGTPAVIGNAGYFTESGSLYRTDGTIAGTVHLNPTLPAGVNFPDVFALQAADGKLLMSGYPDANTAIVATNQQLYSYNPATDAITQITRNAVMVKPTQAGIVYQLDAQTFDSNAVFADNQGYLWSSNGTRAGTRKVLKLKGESDIITAGGILYGNTPENLSYFHATLLGYNGPGQVFSLGHLKSVHFPAKNAALTAAISKIAVAKTVVPGDPVAVTISVVNRGNAAATGSLTLDFYLSAKGTPNGSTVATSLSVDVQGLKPGRSLATVFNLTIPQTAPAGNSMLVALLEQGPGNTTASSKTTLNTKPVKKSLGANVDFGLGGKDPSSLIVDTAAGAQLEFSLTGPGTVAFFDYGSDSYALTLSNASSSTLTIAPVLAGTAVQIGSLLVTGDLGLLLAPGVTFNNANLQINNNLNQLVTGDVTNSGVILQGTTATNVSCGVVTKSTISSAGPIGALSVTSWTPEVQFDGLSATSIGSITATGDFDPNVTAGSIGTVQVGTLSSSNASTWTVTGEIDFITATNLLQGTIVANSISSITAGTISGNICSQTSIGTITATTISGAEILAGINVGADTALGGGDDTFSAGSIASVDVSSTVSNSLIAAGIDVSDDTFPPVGYESLIAGGLIGPVTVGGSIDSTSRIVAASLPVTVSVNSQTVTTATDSNFSVVAIPTSTYQAVQLTNLPDTAQGPADAQAFDNKLFFTATNPAKGKLAAWVSNATASGTAPVTLPSGSTADDITGLSVGSVVLFTDGKTLFQTDGTNVGTHVISLSGVNSSSTISLPGHDAIQVATTQGGSATYQLWIDSSGSVTDLGSINTAVGVTATGLTAGTFFYSIGPALWLASATGAHLTLLGTIPGATSIAAISGRIASAPDSTPVFAAANMADPIGQQLWSFATLGYNANPVELFVESVADDDTTIANLIPGGQGVVFTTDAADDNLGSYFWTSDGIYDDTNPVDTVSGAIFGAAYSDGSIVIGGSGATSTVNLYVNDVAVATICPTGVYQPTNDIATYTSSISAQDVTYFIAPAADEKLSLWKYPSSGGAPSVVMYSATDGQLIAGTGSTGSVYEIVPATATSPSELLLLEPKG